MKFKTILGKFTLLSVFLMTFAFMFGQSPEVVEAKTISFYLKTVLLTGVIGQVAVLFADAYKHIGEGWSWAKFIETKLKPFLYVQLVALIIILMAFYVPQLSDVLDFMSGMTLDTLTVSTLFATATAVVDGILKRYKK